MSRMKLKDIAVEKNERVDNPSSSPYSIFVGLEHYDSGEATIRRYGSTERLESTMKVFHAGDILIARRNVYLKRAATVDFDGLTSGDSIVLHIENEAYRRIIPFVLNTDDFWDYANQHADGSMSKRLSPKLLMEYEFSLPDDSIDRVSNLLWAMERVKNAYRELIARTDDLVKSQFIERFEGHGYETIKAKSFMSNMRNGVSPSKKGSHAEKVLTLSAITQGTFDPDAWKDGIFDDCPPADKRIHTSEFYMCRGNGNKTLVGTAVYSAEDHNDLVFPDTVIAAHVDASIVLMPYLFVAWKMPMVREQIESSARTTNGTYKINQTVLSNIELVVPPIDKQAEFVSLVEQSDKSKFAAQQTLKELTDAQKALMKKIFE